MAILNNQRVYELFGQKLINQVDPVMPHSTLDVPRGAKHGNVSWGNP